MGCAPSRIGRPGVYSQAEDVMTDSKKHKEPVLSTVQPTELIKDQLRPSPPKIFLGDGGPYLRQNSRSEPSNFVPKESSQAKLNEVERKISADVLIQRRVRGIEARAFVAARRISNNADNILMKSLDPFLSPAENARILLLDIASVGYRRLSAALLQVMTNESGFLYAESGTFNARYCSSELCCRGASGEKDLRDV